MNQNGWNRSAVRPGGTYVHAVSKTPANWNLLSAEGNSVDTGMVVQLLTPSAYVAFPDLTHRWNEDLFAREPELAKADPQVIVYRLRPQACWNDGTPVSAADFRYTWQVSSGHHSPACEPSTHAGYELIESVQETDGGLTVVVTLRPGTAFPDWEALFSYLYPAHIAARAGDLATPGGLANAFAEFAGTVPAWSAGPYQVDSVEPGAQVVLVPNPKWYGRVTPSLERIVFRVVADPGALVDAIRDRVVHGVTTNPAAELVDAFRAMEGIRHQLSQGLIWEHLDLNTRNPFLSDVAARRALFTAIDREEILAATVGRYWPGAVLLNSHNFLPGQPAYRDTMTATGHGTGDADRALQLLSAAGYTLRDGVLHTPDGREVAPLRYRYGAGNVMRRRTGELLRDQLRRIGITVRIEPTGQQGTMLADGDYDIVAFGWIGNPVRVGPARDMWASNGGMNYGRFSNEEVDRLIGKANETLEEEEAHELLNRADEILSRDAYCLPLFQMPSLLAVDERFANIRANPTNGLVIYNAQEWGERA